jgi:hypothetical protein
VNIVLLILRFLDVAKFTALTQLPLLISHKPSLQIVGLKISYSPTLALKSPKKYSYGIREVNKYTFHFLIVAVLHNISFPLSVEKCVFSWWFSVSALPSDLHSHEI